MNESEWKTFLTEYNRELLSYEEIVEQLPRRLITAGWLGYPGASEVEITKAEKKLAISLPPSYRAFLKVSNGWRFPSYFILNLLPVAEIAWFREQNRDWIDAYNAPSAKLPSISDEEYLVYGDKQDCCKFREEYLEIALQISEVNDGVVLLNPNVVTHAGEWETWFFANWLPGAVRYRSFDEWIKNERSECYGEFKPLSKTQVKKYATSKKPISVNKAQCLARSGQTELALESLESFASKGDNSAAASLAELYAFLGQWEKVIANAGRLITNPSAVYAGNVFNDMINLLGCAGHHSGRWDRIIEVVASAVKANQSLSNGVQDESFQIRNDKVLRNLIEYANRRGNPPHELLAIFGVWDCMAGMTKQEREAWYQNAVKNVDSIRPDLKKNPQAKAEYFFSLATEVSENEALKLYEAHGTTFHMAWQAAEYIAGVYVRRGNPAAAWGAIEINLSKWWPVDKAQVAPVKLLIDEHLAKLITDDRCRFVLSTPRGPEAAKAII